MSVSEKVKEAAEAAKNAVDHAADKGHEMADHARAKTHDFVDHTKDKAHHLGDEVKEKSHAAGDKIKPQARRVPTAFWIVLALLLVGGGAFFWGRSTAKKGGSSQAKAPAKPAPKQSGPQTLTLDPQQLQYADIALSPAPKVVLPTKLTTIGTVAANLNGEAPVMARLSGKVSRVQVNVGQLVQAGQTLLTISSPELFNAQAAFRDAELREAAARAEYLRLQRLAQLGQYNRPALEQARVYFSQLQGEVQSDKDLVNVAQAQAAQAQTQADLTARQLSRDQALYNALLLSKQDLEQAQANADQAVQARDAALSALHQAVDRQRNAQKRARIAAQGLQRQTKLVQSGALNAVETGPALAAYRQSAHEVEATAANVRLLGGVPMDEADPGGGMLAVTAPIAGIVGDRKVAMGQNVSPNEPLMTVLNLHTVIVQLTVYQEDLAHVRIGQTVEVNSNTAPGQHFFGTVSVISAVVDPSTRAVSVNCVVQNIGGALRPGVYVSGIIYGASRQNTVAVPSGSVQTLEGSQSQGGQSQGSQKVVFTPTGKQGEFAATPVQTGETVNGMTEITSGLTPGQSYVRKNAFVLKSQMIKDTLD